MILINPKAKRDAQLLYQVVYHELIHMKHLASKQFTQWVEEYGPDAAEAITEYEAWKETKGISKMLRYDLLQTNLKAIDKYKQIVQNIASNYFK